MHSDLTCLQYEKLLMETIDIAYPTYIIMMKTAAVGELESLSYSYIYAYFMFIMFELKEIVVHVYVVAICKLGNRV